MGATQAAERLAVFGSSLEKFFVVAGLGFDPY
jgi:hypothetical protein